MPDLALRQALIVSDARMAGSAALRGAVSRLAAELAERSVNVLHAASCAEAQPAVLTNMDLDAILVAADPAAGSAGEPETKRLLEEIRLHQPGVPVFLLADRTAATQAMSPELLADALEYVWIFEDSPAFIAGRIESAMERFRAGLLPPLMRAIWDYNERSHEYSWAAPGHQGGRGFTKSPAGKKFYDFYGENLFRTDTGIERTELGSLLDHTGAFGESEKHAAKVFGADASYSAICGTSGSNRTVMQITLAPGDVAVCDRNCHKSIEQGLILTGATPVYLRPTRNCYGIIGPILPEEFSPEAVAAKIAASPLPHPGNARAYAVVTNCTYDGVCYNAAKVEKMLEKSTDVIHFDEAWYAYARFNKLYADHYAMRGDPKKHRGATVYATHSTHKLLNALSQASFIHVRHGRAAVDDLRMNQAYMLHTTTSPLYAICASNDVAVQMMKESGPALTGEVISEAVDFRQALARLSRKFAGRDEWFFTGWQPPRVTDPDDGKEYDFADAPRELLIREQRCWRLESGAAWHGFAGLPENYALLDPIKVSILTPGMREDGQMQPTGVPAALVAKYLYRAGMVPTRTTDFQLMFLFSMGITRGKWVTLLNALLKFKAEYDRNAPVAEVLPALAQEYPARYAEAGLRDLGERMFSHLAEHTPGAKLDAAFAALPEPALTPREAFLSIVRNQVELVPADQLAGRVAANAVIPYPPGIPMVMSGERFAAEGSPQIAYLEALSRWDREFPGFEHETEGSVVINRTYHVLCVKE